MKQKIKDQIYKHLGKYKGNSLDIHEPGVYRGKEYNHILPKERKDDNLISPFYREAMKDRIDKDSIKLHQFFHHLNSSQALAINFFIPLVVENKLHYIFSALGVDKEIVTHTKLEKVVDSKEFTNFDFFIRGEKNTYYFEVKYTEDGFPRREIKDSTSNKYNQIYRELLKPITHIEKDTFFAHYQLWRNISYAAQGIIVFVFPLFRKDLTAVVESAKEKMHAYQENVKVIYIDDICSEIVQNDTNKRLRNHFSEFSKKYQM